MIAHSRYKNPEISCIAPDVMQAVDSAMDDIMAGYYAAENSYNLPMPRGTQSLGTGADYHYNTETAYFRMVERARHFDRDNMVVGQAVNRLIANIVQDGFTLDVRTPDEGVNAELASAFSEWSTTPEECDFEGEKTFCEMESLTLRHQVVDGDIVPVPTSRGSLQLLENHRMRSPNGRNTKDRIHGVEMSNGKRTGYLLSTRNVGPLETIKSKDLVRVAARNKAGYRNVFHLYMPRRVSQTRGVTCLAPAVVPVTYHDDLQFATMVKAKVASFYALFRQFSEDAEPPEPRRLGAVTTEAASDGTTVAFQQGRPGAEVIGQKGETLTGFAPNIPNPEFFPHATLILTFIAINLDLPVAVLLLDPSDTNFSGWRGAIDQARLRYRAYQRHHRQTFHTPVYEWKVRNFIARDSMLARAANRLGGEIFRHRWNPPTWPYIEPMKDAASDDLIATRNLNSQRRIQSERGRDFDEIAMEIPQDRLRIAENSYDLAQAANKKRPGLEIDWRELAYGHQTSGITYQFGSLTTEDSNGKRNPAPANG